ncbi:MAG: mandelate racemase/muconate lactonizing enzyme family protein [Acidobacteria bacterium]|nr:mandelate racemase/muconate lactonizing enzyme family protein [Acidobacteriota bacterium]
MLNRRSLLFAGLGASARPKALITGLELLPVRATERTVWLLIRVQTDAGVDGWGEASDAFGFGATTRSDAAKMRSVLEGMAPLLVDRSPFEIETFRQTYTYSNLVTATVFSAIEQALWDICGKLLNMPVYGLFGGKTRDRLPVYANINRATKPRTPAGFAASAKAAAGDGFQAVKLAPWDGFPPPGAPPKEVDAFVDQGIDCLFAVREAVGPRVKLMTDCHSFFNVALAIQVARRLEKVSLDWYEEPVAPGQTAETLEIRKGIRQQMAGGETLFGVAGFEPLCRERAVHVIMPDVKHCGGLTEMMHIAAMADAHRVTVAPHNPSGPVATAATVQVCAGMKNFRILEMQWGEVNWRGDLVQPRETFVNGTIGIPDAPGIGVTVDVELGRRYPV